MTSYLRGQLAKLANVHTETVRYYEELGLLPQPRRSESGYRLYSEDALSRLTFIHHAKSCGFTLKEIQKALAASENTRIDLNDFLGAIDKKMTKIRSDIAKKETTLTLLAKLRIHLQAADKSPEIQAMLRTLHLES